MPGIGQTVLYRLPDRLGQPRWRPAVVVETHDEQPQSCDLVVTLSPVDLGEVADEAGHLAGLQLWIGSRFEGDEIRAWRRAA